MFDSYWRFAAERQRIFHLRAQGIPGPWTNDPILVAHRFTNTYRASDRVSQYLIRNVIYEGRQDADEVFFRVLLFKLFNRIDTWSLLLERLGDLPSWRDFQLEAYCQILDAAMSGGTRLYSAAYIMPSPQLGSARKHRNHLELLNMMMLDCAPMKVARSSSLQDVFETLRSYPSLGEFLAFQFAIDLNYSTVIDFDEMDFVVAGPGARNGIRKCFTDVSGLSDAAVIAHMTKIADEEFARLGLHFEKLGGERALKLIDCQNIFCETDKYARVAHPDFLGDSGRSRIKQKFKLNPEPLPQFYPPKWNLRPASPPIDDSGTSSPRKQIPLRYG